MDELIDTEMGLVEVEQSDRDAGAEIMRRICRYGVGIKDDHHVIQAIAKARIAEREACIAAANAMAASWTNGPAQTVYGQGYQAGCRDTAEYVAIHNRTDLAQPTGQE